MEEKKELTKKEADDYECSEDFQEVGQDRRDKEILKFLYCHEMSFLWCFG